MIPIRKTIEKTAKSKKNNYFKINYSFSKFKSRNLEENLQNSGHGLKMSMEEIRETDKLDPKIKKSSVELFNLSIPKLLYHPPNPQIKGLQPKYFHKIKQKSMVIDKSILGLTNLYF